MSALGRLGFALAAALGVAFFATLGAWQQGRGAEKEALLRQQADAMQADAVQPLAAALERDDATVQRLAGVVQYVPPLLLLDGQSNHGRIGLRAYAVARARGAARGVLVDLGWLPMPGDRILPPMAVPEARELSGLMAPWPGQGLRAGANPWPADATSVLLTYLDRDEISQRAGVELAAGVIRLDPTQAYGYQRDQQLLPNSLPPERHYGYAVQWYALAAAVAGVWTVLTLRSLRKEKR